MKVVIVRGPGGGAPAERGTEGTGTSHRIDPVAGGADRAPRNAIDQGETGILAGGLSQGKRPKKGKKGRRKSNFRDCLRQELLLVR